MKPKSFVWPELEHFTQFFECVKMFPPNYVFSDNFSRIVEKINKLNCCLHWNCMRRNTYPNAYATAALHFTAPIFHFIISLISTEYPLDILDIWCCHIACWYTTTIIHIMLSNVKGVHVYCLGILVNLWNLRYIGSFINSFLKNYKYSYTKQTESAPMFS